MPLLVCFFFFDGYLEKKNDGIFKIIIFIFNK